MCEDLDSDQQVNNDFSSFQNEVQSSEELEELLLQQLENLFERPYFSEYRHDANYQASAVFGYQRDNSNTFLITNPESIFMLFDTEVFEQLAEDGQLIILDILDELLKKCSNNALALSEHIQNQTLRQANPPKQSGTGSDKVRKGPDLVIEITRIIFKLVDTFPRTAAKLIVILKKLVHGKRYHKWHLEFIYQ